jgi:REP element-mobilizing transposase RayT
VARPLRLCFADARYHVIARSTSDGALFADDVDRDHFLAGLDRIVDRHRWICHAYCLLSTHYHLAIETPLANLPVGMQQLNGDHASRFNERHGRNGHLFGSRYRSILVEDARYLLAVCRYVVLNPVRAGICDRPEMWTWSSYRATAGLEPTPRLLTTETLLAEVGGDTYPAGQAAFREFVAAGIDGALAERVRGERVGGDGFLRERFGVDPPLAEIPRAQIEPLRRPLVEIFAHEQLPVASAYRSYGYTLREIGAHLGRHYSTVSRRLAREEEALAGEQLAQSLDTVGAVQDLTPG